MVLKLNNNPLISVVVPIYNVEKYLRRCVESIRCQTYSNLEIILVDDGSPDSCGKICDAYRNTDNRIKVIHKKNGGLSDARNVGIKIAQGEYITCIDSDDFISPFFIDNLWTAIQESKCEIATSWFVDYYEGDDITESKKLDINDVQILNKEEFYKNFFTRMALKFQLGESYTRQSCSKGLNILPESFMKIFLLHICLWKR